MRVCHKRLSGPAEVLKKKELKRCPLPDGAVLRSSRSPEEEGTETSAEALPLTQRSSRSPEEEGTETAGADRGRDPGQSSRSPEEEGTETLGRGRPPEWVTSSRSPEEEGTETRTGQSFDFPVRPAEVLKKKELKRCKEAFSG